MNSINKIARNTRNIARGCALIAVRLAKGERILNPCNKKVQKMKKFFSRRNAPAFTAIGANIAGWTVAAMAMRKVGKRFGYTNAADMRRAADKGTWDLILRGTITEDTKLCATQIVVIGGVYAVEWLATSACQKWNDRIRAREAQQNEE